MYTRTHRIGAKCNGSLELSNDSSGITNSFSLYCTLYHRAIAIGQRHHYGRVSLWFTYLHIVLAYSFSNVFVSMCGVIVFVGLPKRTMKNDIRVITMQNTNKVFLYLLSLISCFSIQNTQL